MLCDGRLVGVHIQNSFVDSADTALILQPLLKGRTLRKLLQYSMLTTPSYAFCPYWLMSLIIKYSLNCGVVCWGAGVQIRRECRYEEMGRLMGAITDGNVGTLQREVDTQGAQAVKALHADDVRAAPRHKYSFQDGSVKACDVLMVGCVAGAGSGLHGGLSRQPALPRVPAQRIRRTGVRQPPLQGEKISPRVHPLCGRGLLKARRPSDWQRGMTLGHAAAIRGHVDILDCLLAKGFDVACTNQFVSGALLYYSMRVCACAHVTLKVAPLARGSCC